MARLWIVILALVAVAAVALFTADPFDLFVDPVDREADESVDPIVEEPADATLRGRYVAPQPGAEPRWFEGERVGALDLKLGTSTLKGVVTGAGVPLYAARVQVVLPGEAGEQGVRSRSDGTWEVAGLPAGSHEVRATRPEYVGRTIQAAAVAEDATLDVGTIDLPPRRAPANGFRVHVADEFGRPVAGAKVLATSMMWGLHLSLGPELAGVEGVVEKRATTDADGRASLLDLPPETYDVVVIAEGYQVASKGSVLATEGRVRHLRFRLRPGLSISGTVFNAEGLPLEGAFVTGLHQPSFANSLVALTGADGTFSLDGLRDGKYMVMAGHDDHGEVVANPVASPSTGVRLELQGVGVLELEVVRPDGAPVTAYHVRPYRGGWFQYTYSASYKVDDEAGKHRRTLSPGTYNLAVKSASGDHSADTQVSIQVDETTKVQVVLPVSATLEGVVVDPEGRHLAGAEVFVKRGGFPQEPSREHYARTDVEGRFRITGLPAEKVKLHARHRSWADTVFEVDLADGSPAEEVTVRLPEGGTIEGRVLRGEDAPAAAESVSLMPGVDFFDGRSTQTDDTGAFLFQGLAAGKYMVSTGAFEAAGGGVRETVDVPAEGTVTVVLSVADPEAVGVVVGTVTRGGTPVEGATVTVTDERGWEASTDVQTNALGAFRAEGILAGDATVRVSTSDGVAKSRGVEVPDQGEVQADIDFGGGGLRGRVLTDKGSPASAAWVQIEQLGSGDTWGRIRAQSTTATDGTFQVSGIEAGTYRIRVTSGGFAGLVTDPIAVSDDAVVDAGTFTLASGLSLQGRVVDDAGGPVERATISLEDATGRPVFLFSFVTTGSDGRYEVTGIEPGRYTVGFEASGYAPSSEEVDLSAGSATVDAVLFRGGAIAVTVTDAAGGPLPGARVVLLDASGNPVERTLSLVNILDGDASRTGEDGVARIEDLAPGYYQVTVRRGGWKATGDAPGVQISAGTTSTAVVVLAPEAE